MTIKDPAAGDIPALRRLWQQAFGDPDSFLDQFFSTGFSPQHCRCLYENGVLAAALYWFDCSCNNKKLAYLYAVATDQDHQKQGLCAALMEDTHRHFTSLGYAGAVLVPGSESLRRYYRRFGYKNFGGIQKKTVSANALTADLRSIDVHEYARLRKQYLPQGGIVQEGALLDFFAAFAKFYADNRFVLAVTEENAELLGTAPVLPAASAEEKTILLRTPGDSPFAMYLPLTDMGVTPSYFGIALD